MSAPAVLPPVACSLGPLHAPAGDAHLAHACMRQALERPAACEAAQSAHWLCDACEAGGTGWHMPLLQLAALA